MPEAPRISLRELRGYIADAGELAKGTQIADSGSLSNLARHENRLFCEAKGSGQAPYRVSLTFGEQAGDLKARCSCMAARSRPFCKHSAALLVSWARSPESFAASEAPPAIATPARTKSVKTGKASGADLMQHGVERVATLVRELAVGGVAAASTDRVEQVRQLGEGLRENRLRRLSARTLELSAMIRTAIERRGQIDAVAYADLLSDMLLTARKLEKHLAGDALEDRYVEELIGKTWRKTDRKGVEGLDLVEYAFFTRVTADEYVIRESRFVDLRSGVHYSEKQILPSFLAKRTEPKRSHARSLLPAVSAGMYPGFAPHRLDLDTPPASVPLGPEHVAALLDRAYPGVAAALTAFQEHRRDVFAPDAFPVSVLTELVVAENGRFRAADAGGDALYLANDARLDDALTLALRRGRLVATIGEMTIDGILATLCPMALIVETPAGLDLVSLSAMTTGASGVQQRHARDAESGPAWLEDARIAGISAAAIALGEVRLEMADALVTGLGSLVSRVTDPLAARLTDLGLEKPAALLAELPSRPDPADRLEGFVKVHQVAGLALVRMAGATTVVASDFERLPTLESIAVRRPATVLTRDELLTARLKGKLSRYEAAWHRGKQFESMRAEELLAEWPTTWSDGEAAPFIARILSPCGRQAVQIAEEVLADNRSGMTAQLTALRVLTTAGGEAALAALGKMASSRSATAAVRARAAAVAAAQPQGWRAMLSFGSAAAKPHAMDEALERLRHAQDKDARIAALEELGRTGDEEAIPAVRQVWASDASADVRARAAVALGLLGDSESVETLVSALRNRAVAVKEAKGALAALGHLGDVRGAPEILQALAENWGGPLPTEALSEFGIAALEPILSLVESRPELAQRKSLHHLVMKIASSPQALRILTERVDELLDDSIDAEKAALLLKLTSEAEPLRRTLARRILDRLGEPADKAEKTLVRAAQQALS